MHPRTVVHSKKSSHCDYFFEREEDMERKRETYPDLFVLSAEILNSCCETGCGPLIWKRQFRFM